MLSVSKEWFSNNMDVALLMFSVVSFGIGIVLTCTGIIVYTILKDYRNKVRTKRNDQKDEDIAVKNKKMTYYGSKKIAKSCRHLHRKACSFLFFVGLTLIT